MTLHGSFFPRQRYLSLMKLWALGLVSALVLSACSSGSTTNTGSGTIESGCEAVGQGILWLESDETSNPQKMSEALAWFDIAIPVFRDLSGNNPKYVEYLEMLGRLKSASQNTWNITSAVYDARPLTAFCSAF
jgi:hypothetical protein